MELLKEKRQAVISHAVTQGLNPKAPMKPSGIEWLGDVPEHWEVKRAKHLVIKNGGIQMGPFGGMLLNLNGEDTGFKVYGQENTISGDFTRGERWLSEKRYHALANYHVDIGDLLLTRKGSLGNARLVQWLSQPGIADSDTIRVRVDQRRIMPTFLALLFHEVGYISQQINLAKRGAILAGLNSETVANITIVLPSVTQQKEVMSHLGIELAKFDTLTAEAQRAIDLLQECRTALISAAVTGQIDVRS
jgi:type I restriction enzyme, S subunit